MPVQMFCGVNAAGIAENESAAPFDDAFRQFSYPQDPATQRPVLGTILDPNGWPITQPVKTVCGLIGYEAGDYQFSYEGPANGILFDGAMQISVPPTQGGDGVWRGIVRRSPGGGVGVTLQPNVKNVHLIRPTAGQAGGTWHGRYVKWLQQFPVIRFMDLLQTNNNLVRSSSDRSALPSWPWTIRGKGIPWEALIDLANQIGRNTWWCVGHLLDPPTRALMLRTIAHGLNPGLKFYVQRSNEDANQGFQQWHDDYQNAAQADLNLYPFLPASDPTPPIPGGGYNKTTAWQGIQEVMIAREAHQANADAGRPDDDCRPIHGQWAVNLWYSWFKMFFAQKAYPNEKPSDWFWGACPSCYVFIRDQDNNATTIPNLDALFSYLPKRVQACINGEDGKGKTSNSGLTAHKAQNDAWGIYSCCYEGIEHLTPTGDTALNTIKQNAQRDPRMRSVVYDLVLSSLQNLGYVFMCHLSDITITPWWGLKTGWDDPGPCPKLDSIQSAQPVIGPPIPAPSHPPAPPPVSAALIDQTFSVGQETLRVRVERQV